MAATPAELRARLANPGFLKETSPWLDKTGAYGTAGLTAVDLLLACRRGDADAVSTYWNRLRGEAGRDTAAGVAGGLELLALAFKSVRVSGGECGWPVSSRAPGL
ncbi:hypothetical protein ACKI19_19285 [Streptomyces caniscabiei]|uniref:hypothetical protein n=1 Tax=Streptomyces caniscabiei TaxID=2746961 RepID=UPI0038F60309